MLTLRNWGWWIKEIKIEYTRNGEIEEKLGKPNTYHVNPHNHGQRIWSDEATVWKQSDINKSHSLEIVKIQKSLEVVKDSVDNKSHSL